MNSMAMFWGLFFLMVFLGGLYLMITTPISKKYNSSSYVDIGTGLFLVLLTVIYIVIAYIAPDYNDDGPPTPCSRRSAQANCYSFDTETCESTWASFNEACEEEVRPIREKRPSALLYHLTYRCHATKFDKIAFYNRKNTESPVCKEYFRKLVPEQ